MSGAAILDGSQAFRFAEQAKSVEPGSADLRNLLGDIYLKSGQLEKALAEYSLAVQYAPDRKDFRASLEAAQKLAKK